MLYYKEGTVPNSRPNRIRLENGLTITNPTEDDLIANGWKIAPDVPDSSYPDRIEWNGSDWIIVSPNEFDISIKWESVKQKCKEKLAETDYKVIKAIETSVANGTAVSLDISIVQYRQALRDIYNNVNNLNPFFIQWPTLEETTNGT